MESFPQINKINNYLVKKVNQAIVIDSNWNKPLWKAISPLQIQEFMGPKPRFKPKVQAKMAYDEMAIYVIFKVEDRFVKSIREEYQDPVHKDSAVEFFFTPSEDLSKGYFNLEVNCGGTALFKFRSEEKGSIPIAKHVFDQIGLAHSLPKVIFTEIKTPLNWTIEMRIPIKILTSYFPVDRPSSGIKWRANFYKIADESSNPHYLTWSKVNYPTPNFHLPKFFGFLIFE